VSPAPLLLGGCGILEAEVSFLIARNGWDVGTRFLDSSLHCHLGKLQTGLAGTLRRAAGRNVLVFYGACHPRMDDILAEARVVRTEGQNCVEMLLGHDRFMHELSAGAYFLLEQWAHRWPEIMASTFGNPAIAKEVFQDDRKYLLGVRTPCSGDFRQAAEAAAASVDLPLHWTDVSLDHLERVLRDALARAYETVR